MEACPEICPSIIILLAALAAMTCAWVFSAVAASQRNDQRRYRGDIAIDADAAIMPEARSIDYRETSLSRRRAQRGVLMTGNIVDVRLFTNAPYCLYKWRPYWYEGVPLCWRP